MKRGYESRPVPGEMPTGPQNMGPSVHGHLPSGNSHWSPPAPPVPPMSNSSYSSGPQVQHHAHYYYPRQHQTFQSVSQNPSSSSPGRDPSNMLPRVNQSTQDSEGFPGKPPRFQPSDAPTLPQINFFSHASTGPSPPAYPTATGALSAFGATNPSSEQSPASQIEASAAINSQAPLRIEDLSPGPRAVADKLASTPEKSRVRVNKACERCRLHKIKCSGRYPCLNCQKHASSCRYRSSIPVEPATKSGEFLDVSTHNSDTPGVAAYTEIATPADSESSVKRAKASPEEETSSLETTRYTPRQQFAGSYSAQSDKAYIRYLEDRVRYLESVAIKASFEVPEGNLQTVSHRLDDIEVLQRPTSSKWRICRRYQGALAIELCSSLYKGLSPEAQAQVKIPRTTYFGFNMSGCHYLRPEKLPPLPDSGALSEERKERLVDFFFQEINPLYAILHERVFREQYNIYRGMLDDQKPTNNVALFSAMLSIVIASSIRFTEFMKPRGPSMEMLLLEETLFKYAHKVISIFSAEWESFELIQCWLLAALYLRITHKQTSCFSSFGIALNMCRSMGLEIYDQIAESCPAYEILKAKRIFFAVYSFDRILGLQGGRVSGMTEAEIEGIFPSLDFEKECSGDDWITLPAFAMLQIARLAHYLELTYSSSHDLVTANRMIREFDEVRSWLDANGFNDSKDIFEDNASALDISSIVKSQVKFHFYELVQCVHAKTLFGFFGHRVSIEGMKISTILQCNEDIISLLQKVLDHGVIYTPWYLTLQLILTVGVNSLIFVNGGIHVAESRRLMRSAMGILQVLRNSPVCDESGAVVFKQRFKMVEECHWLFKMISHIMALHYEESLKELNDLGTDHGSPTVNSSSLPFENVKSETVEKEPSSRTKKIEHDEAKENGWNAKATFGNDRNIQQDLSAFGEPLDFPADEYLDNLTWFDKWLNLDSDN